MTDSAVTLATVDWLVHHATIMKMNVDSYWRRAALERKRAIGYPPSRFTAQQITNIMVRTD